MKKLAFGLMMMGLSFQTFAQDVLFEAKLKKEDVPEVVIESVEEDFPDFTVTDYAAIPVEFVEDDVFVNKENLDSNSKDYDSYDITLQGKGRVLDATYDKNGNLISTYEFLKNVAPPTAVSKSIAKVFPGWEITKDNYKMTSYNGKSMNERYKLILSKDKARMKVYTDPNGNILKVVN